MRAQHKIEEGRGDRRSIILTSIPYQVGKSGLVEKLAEAAKDKRIEGISDIRDESSRAGVRVVIELKRDATPEVVLNQIWRNTPAQSNVPANMLAIRGGRPETLSLKDIIEAFVRFREEVITRRTKFELNKARDRAHILLGLVVAVTNLDEVVRIIRASANPGLARETLLAREWPMGEIAPYIKLVEAIEDEDLAAEGSSYRLSDLQVRAILELRLVRLTALGREEIGAELEVLAEAIAGYLAILGDRVKLYAVMREELIEVRDKYATPRLSLITSPADGIEDEDLIEREDMVVTVSHAGYIKRVPLATYREQRRGGKGRSGMSTREQDFVASLFVATTHQPVLFFSSLGQVYKLKVWRLPQAGPTAVGRFLENILPLEKGERITTIMPLPEDEAAWEALDVMFATTGGTVRRNKLSDFTSVNRAGKIAMRLDEGEGIVNVQMCTEMDDVLLTTAKGQCIRFATTDVRVFKGRDSMGVRGINLGEGDKLISMAILRHVEASAEEREAYLRRRRAVAGEVEGEVAVVEEESEALATGAAAETLSQERYAELGALEQIILTVSENGYGKRTSSYEYRITGRGGKGIVAMVVNARNGPLVASFPVESGDGIMLVTDAGQLIRCPVEGIRVAGRGTQGVIVFRTDAKEHVVSVERISEDDANGEAGETGEAGDAAGNAEG
jgi:DNA gyrase subunit A